MKHDEIITEVWKNREAYAEKHGHDIDKMVNDLKKSQAEDGHELVSRKTKLEQVNEPSAPYKKESRS